MLIIRTDTWLTVPVEHSSQMAVAEATAAAWVLPLDQQTDKTRRLIEKLGRPRHRLRRAVVDRQESVWRISFSRLQAPRVLTCGGMQVGFHPKDTYETTILVVPVKPSAAINLGRRLDTDVLQGGLNA